MDLGWGAWTVAKLLRWINWLIEWNVHFSQERINWINWLINWLIEWLVFSQERILLDPGSFSAEDERQVVRDRAPGGGISAPIAREQDDGGGSAPPEFHAGEGCKSRKRGSDSTGPPERKN